MKTLINGYKEETKKAYNSYPEEFDKYFEFYFQKYVKKEADFFIQNLKGNKILDLGSGSGNHAEYFKSKGFDVLCLDISEEMLNFCKKKGLRTILMDIENLKIQEKFDGIWSYTSLLHLPKEKIPKIIPEIKKFLKPEGLLFLSFIDGNGEGFEMNEKFPEVRRWFSYFTDDEIRKLFSNDFDLLYSSTTPYISTRTNEMKYVFLNYIFKL